VPLARVGIGAPSRHTEKPAVTASASALECLAEIRAKAVELRETFGSEAVARALEWAAKRFEEALASADGELLSLSEAAKRSGYSAEHLARLVRSGRIPDPRPCGSKGRIYLRESDLPKRFPKAHNADADVHELASRLFGGRRGRHGHS
jgi:excisionase family DNA binding protein